MEQDTQAPATTLEADGGITARERMHRLGAHVACLSEQAVPEGFAGEFDEILAQLVELADEYGMIGLLELGLRLQDVLNGAGEEGRGATLPDGIAGALRLALEGFPAPDGFVQLLEAIKAGTSGLSEDESRLLEDLIREDLAAVLEDEAAHGIATEGVIEWQPPMALPASAPEGNTTGEDAFSDASCAQDATAALPEPVLHASREDEAGPDADEISRNQEFIDLIRAELAEVIEERDSLLQRLTDADLSVEQRMQIAERIAEQAEHIGKAAGLLGLSGMEQAASYLAYNIGLLFESADVPGEAQAALLAEWPVRMLGYLQDFAKPESSYRLVELLASADWVDPLPEATADTLLQALRSPQFVEEQKPERPTEASAEDVSLDIPQDVNPDLLDGLLTELPSQTESFAAAIGAVVNNGSLQDVTVAQRIAHTLKGAGNVVGVRGIANLTHHLEDILEMLAKHGRRPGRQLGDVLMQASDCLETMSDALLGRDAAPADALMVLNQVLAWARRLDEEGINAVDADDAVVNATAETVATSVSETAAPAADARAAESSLRISSHLADELLRLSGENMISTVQVQEQVRQATRRVRALQDHNQLLQRLAFDLEQLVDIEGITHRIDSSSRESEFDPLEMDQYNDLHSFSRRLVEAVTDSLEFTQSLADQLDELGALVIDQDRLNKESQETILRTRMVPVSTVVPRLRRGVRQACRLTGKDVDLRIRGESTFMDSEVLGDLIDPLMHLIRNAIDHGIEPDDIRAARDYKPRQGYVEVAFERRGDLMVVTVLDDGAGVDLARVEARAQQRGWLSRGQSLPENELIRLIMEPGFSTRDDVSQVSGRGIGLDAVNSSVRAMKGSVALESVPGFGSMFELSIPVSRLSAHSLLVRANQSVFAISSRGIEEIVSADAGQLKQLGDKLVYQLGDELHGVKDINGLLGMPGDRRDHERSSQPILIVREDSGARTAVLVQSILESKSLVIKALGEYVPKAPGLVGGTILGDGSVAPVIDLPELLQSEVSGKIRAALDADPASLTAQARLPLALVVDDSLSARRSLAQFVQDLGFEVRTARDGMEAVDVIERRRPDILLVDMEMPRMNGLELAAHLRNQADTAGLPIVMVTSRSTDKHRMKAEEVGINRYIVKPFGDDELSSAIRESMGFGHG